MNGDLRAALLTDLDLLFWEQRNRIGRTVADADQRRRHRRAHVDIVFSRGSLDDRVFASDLDREPNCLESRTASRRRTFDIDLPDSSVG